MTNLSPHVLASKWSHQNCCSRCSPAHVERERCGRAKVAQMHPGNIPQRPGSVPATSRQQRRAHQQAAPGHRQAAPGHIQAAPGHRQAAPGHRPGDNLLPLTCADFRWLLLTCADLRWLALTSADFRWGREVMDPSFVKTNAFSTFLAGPPFGNCV